MLQPRTIRAWLRRANLLLLAVLAWVAVEALSPHSPGEPPLLPRPTAARDPSSLIRRPVEDREALLALVQRFHPPGAARFTPVDPRPAEATRLPLRAFQVAMVIRQGAADVAVMLTSKDPSRKETYYLRGREPDEDCVLLSARYDKEFGYFHVRRGEEAFTFKFCFDEPARSSTLWRVGDRPVFAEGDDETTRGGRTALGPAPHDLALKGLPFYGSGGRVVGFRLTGIRPGSWARDLGLEPGDVIRSVGSDAVCDVGAFRTRLGTGWQPTTLTVQRGLGPGARVLTLAAN